MDLRARDHNKRHSPELFSLEEHRHDPKQTASSFPSFANGIYLLEKKRTMLVFKLTALV